MLRVNASHASVIDVLQNVFSVVPFSQPHIVRQLNTSLILIASRVVKSKIFQSKIEKMGFKTMLNCALLIGMTTPL